MPDKLIDFWVVFIVIVTDTNIDNYPVINLNCLRLLLILPKKKYVVYFKNQTFYMTTCKATLN